MDTSFPPDGGKARMAGQVLSGGGIALCTEHSPLWIPCPDLSDPDEAVE